jgi:hypothetical protein
MNMDIDILSTDFPNKYLIILKERKKNKIFYCGELMKDVIRCYRDGMNMESITHFINATHNCSYEEIDRENLKYEFNKKRYALFFFKEKYYSFDKFSYRGLYQTTN